MNKSLSTAAIYLGANVLNAAIPLLLLPVLTRVLSPGDYGRVAVFEAAVASLAGLTGLSTHGAVGVRYFRDDREQFPMYVANCLLILLVSSGAVAGLVVLAGISGAFTGIIETHWILFAVVVALLQFIVNIRLVIWQSRSEAVRYGAFQTVQCLLNAALSLLLVVYLSLGSAGRIAGFGGAVIVSGVIAFWSMQTAGWIKWQRNDDHLRDALRFGVPLIPHTLGALAVTFADRFIISERLGAQATGLYFAAVQLATPMLMLGSAFNRAFVPWLFARLASGENTRAVAVSYTAVLGFLLAGITYGLVVHSALGLVLGERFGASKSLAPILIVGTTFQAAYYAVVNYIFYAKRTVYLSVVTCASGVLYLVGAWVIVRRFGLFGMAVWFSCIQCAMFFLVWIMSSRVSPQPWSNLSSVRNELWNLAR